MPARDDPQRPPPPPPDNDWALFLDVDGCLLEFANTPTDVVVPTALSISLQRLSERLDGALALVSGRSLETLDGLFAPLRLPAAGLHGLQRRDRDGHVDAPDAPSALDTLDEQARALAASYPGAVVEHKGATLALHWRAAPSAESAFRKFAQTALPDLPDYRVQAGDHVVELRPRGADKGDAIATLLERPPFRGRRPVFAGDDLTDEHGFAVVNARDGISVLVGARESSAARFALAGPAAVHAWLDSRHGDSQ